MTMMGAPNLIRGGSHSGNVAAEELAKQDLLDIVSSDYVPSALLLSAFHLARVWDDLPRAVATVTRGPAQAARLTGRRAASSPSERQSPGSTRQNGWSFGSR